MRSRNNFAHSEHMHLGGIHTKTGLRAGLLMRMLAAFLSYAVWMMPMIVTAPGVFDLCEEYDIQVPTPMSEEEEELKHSKLPPLHQWITGHDDLEGLGRVVRAAGPAPPASLLEVPYPPPRTGRC